MARSDTTPTFAGFPTFLRAPLVRPNEVPADAVSEFVKVASTRIDPAAYAARRGEILTDDRNPVEYIVAKQLRKGERQ